MLFFKKAYKRIINDITSLIISLSLFVKLIFKSIIFKKKIYIFGIPIHGNIGDHAILYAEELFLKENFKNYKIIEVPSKFNSKFLKIIIKNNTIIYTGGGFLGSLWLNEEKMFRETLKMYPKNKIIVFPHTYYFSNDAEGIKILNESIKEYSSHENLHLICREKYSYDFMRKYFEKCNVYLAPDMVLYLDRSNDNISRNGVLFCIRNDKEKIDYNFDNTINELKKCGYDFISYSSTVLNKNIFPINRKKTIYKKLNEFSKYELIITDRLHGMIFAYLSNTPCIVLSNKSYKITGVYEWIKDCNYINLVKIINSNIISDIIKEKDIKKFDKNNYNILIELLKQK